eukprot:1172568-Pyramimonas_sp.AAC.1
MARIEAMQGSISALGTQARECFNNLDKIVHERFGAIERRMDNAENTLGGIQQDIQAFKIELNMVKNTPVAEAAAT